MADCPADMTPDQLRAWVAEHLMYEVDTLIYTTLEIGKCEGELSHGENVLLDAFAVHARCLNDFLWRDRNARKPRDAFASDFCAPGEWKRARKQLPRRALVEIRNRGRFGREVVHLTYDRIDGSGEDKEWPCGDVLIELAGALGSFADLALPDRLWDRDRSKLSDLLVGRDSAGPPLGSIAGATGMTVGQIRQFTGGTAHVQDIWGGGVGS